MPKDDKGVQTEEVSTGTESTETETQETEEQTQTQPLTPEQEARIQQIIAEGTEQARREIQSAKDKAKAEVETAREGARYYQRLATGYETGFGAENPEQAELIKTRAELAARQRRDAEEIQRQQAEKFGQDFHGNMNQFITSAGLDPQDKRIDWAEDVAGDYLAKLQRILASVTKAQKEDAKTADGKRSQEVKDVEQRLRKELGLDLVDTSASGGMSKGIPTDMNKFREWVEGLSPQEFKEKKKDIDEMMSKGLIK